MIIITNYNKKMEAKHRAKEKKHYVNFIKSSIKPSRIMSATSSDDVESMFILRFGGFFFKI